SDHGHGALLRIADCGRQPAGGPALRVARSAHSAGGDRMNIRRLVTLETVGAAMVTVLVIVALFAPMLAPHDPTIVVAPTFGDPGAPTLAFPMGTDELGRDVLSRIIFGARISLTVGVAAMAVTMTIGVAIGLCSGFFGGAVDFILMRFTDLMLSLPPLLLAMALVAVLGPSLRTIFMDVDRTRGAGGNACDVPAGFRGRRCGSGRAVTPIDRATYHPQRPADNRR